jgi:hypothetical protein
VSGGRFRRMKLGSRSDATGAGSALSAAGASRVKAPRAASMRLVLDVPAREDADEWVLSEENMPESAPHRDAVDLLRLILLAFVARTRR